jgi:hypothetical protein
MLTVTITYPTADALIAGRTTREVVALVEANPALTEAQRADIVRALTERKARRAAK